jgi:hypothetical protein
MSIAGGIDLVITASGQYSQQRKQVGLFNFEAVHFLSSMIGRWVRHSPVRPASPMPGEDSSQMWLQSLVPIV